MTGARPRRPSRSGSRSWRRSRFEDLEQPVTLIVVGFSIFTSHDDSVPRFGSSEIQPSLSGG